MFGRTWGSEGNSQDSDRAGNGELVDVGPGLLSDLGVSVKGVKPQPE